jgi:acetaldehyde dehydrogenase (acetylating)
MVQREAVEMLKDRDLLSIQEARDLCESAHLAQKKFEHFTQAQVDSIIAKIAEAARKEARRLADMAAEETGFGKADDKYLKNVFCSEFLLKHIKDLRTVGVLREIRDQGIVEIAVPVGVVCAIVPSTNPTSTTIFKTLISLKAGNGVVFSPHPAATRSTNETARVLIKASLEAGAPEGLIGCLSAPTPQATQELMRNRRIGVILATGGMGLVKAAYSSGKPAYGVGPGNVPAFIERSADVGRAVSDIFTGTCFDNGTLCSSEQSMIVDEPIKEEAIARAVELGGVFLNPEQVAQLERVAITQDGALNSKIVGQSAKRIAEMAGIAVPATTRVLLIPLTGVGKEHPLSIEKLSPLLAFYVARDWREACDLCLRILAYGGLGHTLGLHSNNPEVIREFAMQKPAFRIIVNSNTSLGAVGFTTNLMPSMTLGCGTLGGNITSDNISPMHLFHIKRLAFGVREVTGESRSYPSTAAGSSPISRADVGRLVEEYLKQRLEPVSLQPPDTAPPSSSSVLPAESASSHSDPPAVDFVCEDDVRRALNSGARIRVHSRTIITPSARDLGETRGVFVSI